MPTNKSVHSHFDFAIIGVGPAGSTLARLLDTKFKVLVLDKKSEQPDSFRKPCGGLLSQDAQKALASYDLTLPKNVLVDPQIFSVRTIDLDHNLTRHYQRFYLNLDRHKFDLWLESLIPASVELHSNCCCTKVAQQSDGSFQITYLENGTSHTATCNSLIGADGAHSLVRRTFFPNLAWRTYLSIQQWFPEQHANPFYSCIFDSANTDCCSWSISKDHYFIFGGAYPKDHGMDRFLAQKKALSQKGFCFGNPVRTEACEVLRPTGFHSFCCGGKNLYLIGEAAGFISPSSLEGISYAIASASKLAAILNSTETGKNMSDSRKVLASYKRQTLGIRWKLVLKVAKSPFMYQPFLRKLVMKSGLTSIKIIS